VSRPLSVALIGNPNTGKSTLFTALVGIHQRTGNYPGVTVEKKTGWMEHEGRRYAVTDLPGLYSLSPRSRDETVALNVLLGRYRGSPPVDAIICTVDASNLARNLYLVSQVLELRLPTVVGLNMLDVAADQGVVIDVRRLEQELGVPVVPMQAHRRIGVPELKDALRRARAAAPSAARGPLPEAVQREVENLTALVACHATSDRVDARGAQHRRRFRCRGQRRGSQAAGDPSQSGLRTLPAWLVQRLLFDVSGQLETEILGEGGHCVREELLAARERLAKAGCRVPGVETAARHEWASRTLRAAVTQPRQSRVTGTDRADRLLTHRLWGTIVFALVMLAMFQAVFVWAEPLTHGIESGMKLLGQWAESLLPEGMWQSLLVGGVLAGVGSVLSFLPQIAILFLFLAVLEDCGYMARAAFLMDRLMVRVGLSGRSFIPLVSCFGCTIPGVMACRVIENERDRLTTILVAPLITCSARLPVFTLLIAAFIPPRAYAGGLVSLQGLTLVAMYVLGVVTAVVVARVLKGSVLRGRTPPLWMELPTYKWPSTRTVAFRVIERALSFVRFAGTMIVAVSILVWAALYWPHDAQTVEAPFLAQKEDLQSRLETLSPDDPQRIEVLAQSAALRREIEGAYQRQSYLGRFGRVVEPVFRPLGWDWRIGAAVMASLPAREIVVATLGVIFSSNGDDPKNAAEPANPQTGLRVATWEGTGRPLFTIPVALSLMVFCALCAQCAPTLAVIRRETGSWRWPLFAFGYMTALAYLGALVTYQLGTWINRWVAI
jgi:ferrous iron transport protein B